MAFFSLSLVILVFILCIIVLLSYLMFKNSNPSLISISVTPENSEVEINKKQQFRVVAKYSDGISSDITKFIKWSSTDISVLMISESGNCTALKEGDVKVCARYCKLTAKALVKVKDSKFGC